MDASKRCGKLKWKISDGRKGFAKRHIHKMMRRYGKQVVRDDEREHLQSNEERLPN